MTPYLRLVHRTNGDWWVVDDFEKSLPLAVCKTLQTARLIASCMAETGRYNFNGY